MKIRGNIQELDDLILGLRAIKRAVEGNHDTMSLAFGDPPYKVSAHSWKTKSGWSFRVDRIY